MGRFSRLGFDYAAVSFCRGRGNAVFAQQTAGKWREQEKTIFSYSQVVIDTVDRATPGIGLGDDDYTAFGKTNQNDLNIKSAVDINSDTYADSIGYKNVISFGADPTKVANSTKAFQAAADAG